jgi:hypothetical protein
LPGWAKLTKGKLPLTKVKFEKFCILGDPMQEKEVEAVVLGMCI